MDTHLGVNNVHTALWFHVEVIDHNTTALPLPLVSLRFIPEDGRRHKAWSKLLPNPNLMPARHSAVIQHHRHHRIQIDHWLLLPYLFFFMFITFTFYFIMKW